MLRGEGAYAIRFTQHVPLSYPVRLDNSFSTTATRALSAANACSSASWRRWLVWFCCPCCNNCPITCSTLKRSVSQSLSNSAHAYIAIFISPPFRLGWMRRIPPTNDHRPTFVLRRSSVVVRRTRRDAIKKRPPLTCFCRCNNPQRKSNCQSGRFSLVHPRKESRIESAAHTGCHSWVVSRLCVFAHVGAAIFLLWL